MREIIFKAKRKDNGEWAEGLPTVMWGQYHIINPNDENTAYPIDEKTICQYIGLTDKNGRKIWENDIVEIPVENGYFLVEWSETEARWQMNNEEDRLIVDFDNYWSYQVEVIGNVFDNPELLEKAR